ncbi:S41 family peptidase [Hymenobacter sp. BT770]|uniref:S41 family peptidase n=1 Tax=Hymenobacter sp. BT770 TaxID=2886942 RepID=UPI001D121C8F|nr:S41 family peptidase [Hymenobacter sp. BT770]MCC3153762.1 S41 family peptidase [Hymenobacter sp. BT770]MDO3416896.1 S41 family peptidase [Hymenobacter sp. BT770]
MSSSSSAASETARPAPSRGRRGWLRQGVLLMLAMGCGVLVANNPFRPSSENPDATARGYLRFKEILSYVDRDYADSVDTEALADYAVGQMLEKLDPHSVYIPARDREKTDSFLQSDFDGIGIEFNLFRDTMTVVAPLSGGPAEQAGVQAGDQILSIANKRVSGGHLSTARLSELLRGPRGSSVTMELRRRGQGHPLNLTIPRSRVPNASVDAAYLVDGQTGYIKVSRFASNTYDEFKAALADLRRQGLTRLVLDLRGNPGGYLDRATQLADEFIGGSRKIVYTDGKGEQYDSQTYARVAGEFEEGALVVLVDEGSASAAEVVAGALQDHDRATIVGRRTFGKGLVQQPIALSDGSELRLTIARYYTPSGRSIQKPYGANYAEYRADVANRAARGELQSADSIRFAKELRFRTDHGRTVYGGGGIMPDVFVPRDTLAHSAYVTKLLSYGVARAFALAFYQAHKAELEGLRFEQFHATFRISDAQLVSLAAQAAQVGVTTDVASIRRCAPLLRNQLKAYIARSAYGPVAYYTVLREQDPELQRALHVVSDSTAQLALLGK